MNDMTPPALRGGKGGSLLERAAARYGLTPGAMPATPVFAPEPVRPARRRVAVDRVALAERGMIVPGATAGPLAEQFRLVKRQLLRTARTDPSAQARPGTTILVCSARPDDGKTFCAINLALSLAAEKDVEVLLVDADLPKPDVMAALGVEADGPGLLDALADPALDIEGCILDTDVPQLALLPTGARSVADTELLASARARAVIDRLATANPRRIVVIDSPPALAASPASVLAGLVGQVMLVVRADRTSEADLRDAVGLLDAGAHISLVLNAVAHQPGTRAFGDYYGEGAGA